MAGDAGPIMDLVAGPHGSGKSTFFHVARHGLDAINVDERRKTLNQGRAQKIPADVQRRATAEYEAFIENHIRGKRSFSIEVTLAKEITFQQAARARANGFQVRLTYVAAEVDDCVDRVARRLEGGEHGVPEATIRATHAASTQADDGGADELKPVRGRPSRGRGSMGLENQP